MAICFVRARVLGRSGGRSAVAAAAYRSGSNITDEQTGITHDYTKKQGVEYSEILSPIPILATRENEWLTDRAALWNRVEASEKRYDAQLAREMIIAIPRELDREDQIALVREYVQNTLVDRGMIADINLHHLDSDNPHAHVMLTMRELKIDQQGIVSFGNKDRGWNDKKLLQTQMQEWETLTNQYLQRAGIDTRIDARSYEEQGIARIPQVHVGAAAWRLEQQGIRTTPGDRNREVAAANLAIENSQTEIITAQGNIEIELRLEIEQRAKAAAKAERAAAQKTKIADSQAVPQSILDLVMTKLEAHQQTPPPASASKIVQRAAHQQEYQRISAKIKRLIIAECEADPFIVHIPDFGKHELEFIDLFTKYMTEKNGYTNPDRTEPTLTISDYQREYDRRIFEYVVENPSVAKMREGLINLHFDIEREMTAEGYDREKSTVKNADNESIEFTVTINSDDPEETEESLQDRLNREIISNHKPAQPRQNSQDNDLLL